MTVPQLLLYKTKVHEQANIYVVQGNSFAYILEDHFRLHYFPNFSQTPKLCVSSMKISYLAQSLRKVKRSAFGQNDAIIVCHHFA